MRLLKLLLVLFVYTAAASPAWAQYARRDAAFDAAQAAYGRSDYATAIRLWRPLAEQGNAGAQHSLGVMYFGGHGVAQNYVQAHLWFTLAESQGYAGFPGNAHSKSWRYVVERTKMTPAQLAVAQRLAREWKPETAK